MENSSSLHSAILSHGADNKSKLQQARSFLESGKLNEGKTLFQQLILDNDLRSDAYYYLGLIELHLKSFSAAQDYFFMATQVNPQNANAYFYLGSVCEQQNEIAQAERFYQKALSVNSNHKSARQRLIQLNLKRNPASTTTINTDVNVKAPEESIVQAAINNPAPSTFLAEKNTSPEILQPISEFYLQLKEDPAPAAKRIIGLIDELQLNVKPTLTSQAGSVVQRLVILSAKVLVYMLFAGFAIFVIYNLSNRFSSSPASPGGFGMPPFLRVDLLLIIFLTIVGGALIVYVLEAMNKQYEFTQGKIIVTGGALTKSVKVIELFRVQEVEMSQDFFNQMTGDGSLNLKVSGNDKPLRLVGIAKADKLRHMVSRLRELNVLLRSINWIVSLRN